MGAGDVQLAENVGALMRRRGWTARQLAIRARMSKSTLDDVLYARHSPRVRTLRALREALGCTWEELLG